MPTYTHICQRSECLHEWEDYYSIKADPPKTCPKCQQETAQRVISGGSGRGIVELTGHDLDAKIKEDVRQLKSEAANSEQKYANLIGEGKYQELQQGLDRGKRFRR